MTLMVRILLVMAYYPAATMVIHGMGARKSATWLLARIGAAISVDPASPLGILRPIMIRPRLLPARHEPS